MRLVDRKPPSIYDYWQALNVIEKEVNIQKSQVIMPAGIEHWQHLVILDEWVKSQKDRIVVYLNRYSAYTERLLNALDKVMD